MTGPDAAATGPDPAITGPHLLAVDAGTGSCRAVLFDQQARQVAVAQHEWTHHEPPDAPGGQDFDVETNWALIARCIRQVVAQARLRPEQVVAVAATSMREGIVLFDPDGRELWACPNVDSRAGAQAEDLVRSGAAEQIYRLAGDWVSITSPARLRWLAAHRPALFDRVAGVGLLSDWIAYRLSDVLVTEPSCGSSSGMFDLSTRGWSAEIAQLCGLSLQALPPVVNPGTVIGRVSPAAAEATGLSPDTLVVAGGADTQLGLAGAGIRPGELAVVGGTFWQATLLVDEPVIDPQRRLRTLCHVTPNQWMIEGIGFYSGMSLRWMRDAFCRSEVEQAAREGVDPYVVMERAAAQIPAGSNGVIAVLSEVMNARRWVHASPSFLQLDLADPAGTGTAACIRAVQEAAGYVTRAHRDLLTEVTGVPVDEIVFTGGAAKGSLWPQIMADVLGVPVHVPVVTESSARGAAVLAGMGAGIFAGPDDVPELRDRDRTVLPDPAATATYDQGYSRWREVYARMLAISEDGLLRPLWRAAGADVTPVGAGV